MKTHIIAFVALGLSACASLEQFREDTKNQLTPEVIPLVALCDSALTSGKLDEAALIDLGLVKNEESEILLFDNGLPVKKGGIISGTGLSLAFDESGGKCSIAVGPDGFPATIPSIVGEELVSLGYIVGEKGRQFSKGEKTFEVSSSRSGNQISYFTTRVTIKSK